MAMIAASRCGDRRIATAEAARSASATPPPSSTRAPGSEILVEIIRQIARRGIGKIALFVGSEDVYGEFFVEPFLLLLQAGVLFPDIFRLEAGFILERRNTRRGNPEQRWV